MRKTEKTVMIIDDDKDFLSELQETLELSGYRVIAVNDSANAVETAKQNKPGVIFLDLKMPEKNGFQIAHELRRLAEFKNTVIIAMTAWFDNKSNPLLDVCGFNDYLSKPFYPLDMIVRIESVFKNPGETAQGKTVDSDSRMKIPRQKKIKPFGKTR